MDGGRGGRDHKRRGALVPERWMDGQTDDGSGGSRRSSAHYHGRGGRRGGKPLKAEPADSSHHRHSPTHLHFAFCPSFQLFFGIFISPGSLFPHTHTHTGAERQAHLNFLPQGHAVKEDKVVSMFCSSYLCWRRHAA